MLHLYLIYCTSCIILILFQTVLVTGGSTGLGLNAGRQLAEKGANVIIAARNVDKLEKGVRYITVK